jgi:predicted peptidase
VGECGAIAGLVGCTGEEDVVTRFIRLALLVAAMLAVLVPAVGVASAQTGTANPVVRADLITEVLPEGARVVAVAIRYTRAFDVNRIRLDPSAFSVQATIDGETAPRTVTDVYPNTAARVDTRAAKGRSGPYLIIELDPDDPNAAAQRYTEETWTVPLPLDGAYAVRQTADIVDPGGRVVLPASPLAIANHGVINRIVDDFLPMSFTDSAGSTMEFRLYLPRGYRNDPAARRSYPLVTFLHGAGETGDNNITQLTANQGGVAFAKPERQRTDPSFVLAPQLPPPIRDFPNNNWALPARQATVIELIDAIAAAYPVDQDRLYLTGLSMGAFGIYGILPNHPDKFAGALAIAGGELNNDLSRIPLFRDLPLWITHSVDDPVVDYTLGSLAIANALEAAGTPVTRGTWPGDLDDEAAEARARELLRTARRAGSHVLLTAYAAGTTPLNAHFSWIPTYLNDVMIDWLYSQDRSPESRQATARAKLEAAGSR